MVFWFPEQSGSWFKRMWPTIAWINYMAYKISCPGWLEFLLEHGRSRFITKEGTEVKHPLTEAPLLIARVSFAACTYKREEPQLFWILFCPDLFLSRFQTLGDSYTFKGDCTELAISILGLWVAEGLLEHFYFSAGLEVQLLQQGGAQVVPLYPGMEDLRVSACSLG